jgi:hypothetical protein
MGVITVDNHVPSSKFNRFYHIEALFGKLGARPTVHPGRISLNQKIAEVGLTHESSPLRQNHVSDHTECSEIISPDYDNGMELFLVHIPCIFIDLRPMLQTHI